MKRKACLAALLLVLCGCGATYRLVYSSGFTFASYDYLVVAKPEPLSSTSLYGMDVEFSNLMARYNMKVVGDREFADLPSDQKKRTLLARMSLIASSRKVNLLSVSFDDMVTGKVVASVTTKAKGDMFDTSDRTKAFEALSKAITQSLERDKGLSVSDHPQER